MSYVGYILAAILLLLLMITVHEFGHYIAGKIFGFGIEEFAIGFGPKLYRKQRKNGEYFSVRLLPLGGFCAFKGEDEDDPDPSAFNNRKPWQRIIVLASGALMNVITALLIIFILFAAYGQMSLLVGSEPAGEAYSFQQYDVILQAEGRNVYMTTDLMEVLDGRKEGDIVHFVVRRGGEDVEIEVKLRADAVFGSVEDASKAFEYLGVNEIYATYVRFGFFESIGRAFTYAWRIGGSIFTVLGQLLTGHLLTVRDRRTGDHGGRYRLCHSERRFCLLAGNGGVYRHQPRRVQPAPHSCAGRLPHRVHRGGMDQEKAVEPQGGGDNPRGGLYFPVRLCDFSRRSEIVLDKGSNPLICLK